MTHWEDQAIRWGVQLTHFLLILSVVSVGIGTALVFRELGMLIGLVLSIPIGKMLAAFWASIAVAVELTLRFPLKSALLALLAAGVTALVSSNLSDPWGFEYTLMLFLLVWSVVLWIWGFRKGGREFTEFGAGEGFLSFWVGFIPALLLQWLHADPGVTWGASLGIGILYALFRVPQVYRAFRPWLR